LICGDPASVSVLRLIERIAPSDIPVLISGEAGTGKETFARHLHQVSGRIGPFVAVQCGAQTRSPEPWDHLQTNSEPEDARTASREDLSARFEAADGGTLFLDEPSDLSCSLQAGLLNLLRDQSPLAGAAAARVRIVTATTISPAGVIAADSIRADLLYRLNGACISLLPLSHRKGDIAPLAQHIVRASERRLKLKAMELTREAIDALERYAWPGNVRELENVVHLGVLLAAPEQVLEAKHLQLENRPRRSGIERPLTYRSDAPEQAISALLTDLFRSPGPSLFARLEGNIIAEAFHFSGGSQARTAELLGITRNVLRTLLKKHRLHQTRAYAVSGHSQER
jgi:DNA-binding NtrC family response regulator